jgi:biotin carboxylase
MRTVWIGAAGTGTGFGLARSVRDHWGDGVRIVAADTNPPHLVAASALADETVQVRPFAEPEFADQLREGLERTGADTYVPIIDGEIVLAAELREAGSLDGIAVAAPSREAARLCGDKLAMAGWLREQGLPAPDAWSLDDAPRDGRPLVLKPRAGVGSVGVRTLAAAGELEVAAELPDADSLLVEELLEQPEVTIDAFRSADGALVRALCRERVEVKAGVSTKARVFSDGGLVELTRALGDRLPLSGAFCFQVMRDATGGRAIVDVNPRHGAGSRMSAALGFDVMAAAMAALWGEDPEPFLMVPDGEHFVVRQYTEFVL